MGVMDTGKMLMKARKAQSQMKKISAAGQSKTGNTAVLLNGLNEIEEVLFNFLIDEDGPETMTVDRKFFVDLQKEVIDAFKAAKKELEQQIAQNMDINSVRDMLGV